MPFSDPQKAKEYNQRPDVKERKRLLMIEYNHRPEVIKNKSLWHKLNKWKRDLKRKDENFKQNNRDYAMRPENKIKRQIRQQTQEYKLWMKKYRENNPEKLLEWGKKHAKKHGAIFKMPYRIYKFALQQWSRSVRRRDNNTCWVCGSKENIEANHILPKKDYPELSLDVDNGITLCDKDHNWYHGMVGWK
jgi:hypothetical protein